jgi:hypothetical protein
MMDMDQSEAYRSAWLKAERELEIRQFLSVPATGWWQVGGPRVDEDGAPHEREVPFPEPIPSSPGK